jgi:hypothetical protein
LGRGIYTKNEVEAQIEGSLKLTWVESRLAAFDDITEQGMLPGLLPKPGPQKQSEKALFPCKYSSLFKCLWGAASHTFRKHFWCVLEPNLALEISWAQPGIRQRL